MAEVLSTWCGRTSRSGLKAVAAALATKRSRLAQAASDLVEGPAAVVGVADVELHRAAFPAAPLDLASDLEWRGALVAAVADRGPSRRARRAPGRRRGRCREAPGDERELAVEVTHARAPTTTVRMEPRARAQDLRGAGSRRVVAERPWVCNICRTTHPWRRMRQVSVDKRDLDVARAHAVLSSSSFRRLVDRGQAIARYRRLCAISRAIIDDVLILRAARSDGTRRISLAGRAARMGSRSVRPLVRGSTSTSDRRRGPSGRGGRSLVRPGMNP